MLNFSRSKSILLLSVMAATAGCDRKGVEPVKTSPDPRIAKAFAASEPQFCTFQMLYSDASADTPDGLVRTRYVVVGKSKAEMLAAFSATCAASAAAPKVECGKYLSSNEYPCVAASLFGPSADTTGDWTCSLKFTANDTEESLEKTGSSSAAAIQAAFTACAAMTDDSTTTVSPSVSPSMDTADFTRLDATLALDEETSGSAPSATPSTTPSGTPSPTPSVSPSPTPPPTIYLKPSKRRDACATAMIAEKMTCVNSNSYAPVTPPALPKRHLHR